MNKEQIDENERKEWALLMNADIEQLRQQLATAQASDAELMKALVKITTVCDSSPVRIYQTMEGIARKAIAAHKSRKE